MLPERCPEHNTNVMKHIRSSGADRALCGEHKTLSCGCESSVHFEGAPTFWREHHMTILR